MTAIDTNLKGTKELYHVVCDDGDEKDLHFNECRGQGAVLLYRSTKNQEGSDSLQSADE